MVSEEPSEEERLVRWGIVDYCSLAPYVGYGSEVCSFPC